MPRRLRFLLLTLSVAGVLVCAPAASAAPGELDPSFGSGGTVRLLTSEKEVAIRAVAVQPDLKVVIAGAEDPGSVILVRLLPGGGLDPSFGEGGKVTTPFPGGFGEARAITLQPDGKIVVAGGAKGLVNNEFLVARYNADGSPDASFGGGDGIQLVPVGPSHDTAEAVAIGSGGHILATGDSELGPKALGAGVAVLKPEGNPDPAFAEDGTTVVSTTMDETDQGEAIAELSGGRILIGDSTGAGAGDGFTLVRLLSSGQFDLDFGGGDGRVTTPIPGSNAGGRLTDFALRPDGRIVASGYGYDEIASPPSLDSKFAAVGYLANGELDASFAGTGIFTRQVADGADAARVVELTATGKLLLAGNYTPVPSNTSTALLRLDPLGALDPTFGAGGQVLRGVTAPFGDILQDAALDAEERLVVVSTAFEGGGITTTVVSRFLGDPRPPTPTPTAGAVSSPVNLAARAWMKKVPRKVAAKRLKRFSGTASDPDGNGVKSVQIALVRRVVKRGANKARLLCFALKSNKPSFKRTKRKGKQCPQRWLTVKGKEKWSFRLKGALPPGRYVVFARAIDGAGKTETKFSRQLRNRYGFRVAPSR